jgi:hypothetical protein
VDLLYITVILLLLLATWGLALAIDRMGDEQ